jgi:formamidopyrimidine-DNA glycosylase
MKHVLRTAIDRKADPDQMPKSWIIPHRHGDQTCPKCGGPIKSMKVAGRTAYYCPKEQSG